MNIPKVELNIVTIEEFKKLRELVLELARYHCGTVNELGLLIKSVGEFKQNIAEIFSDFEDRITKLEDEISYLRAEIEEIKDLAEW